MLKSQRNRLAALRRKARNKRTTDEISELIALSSIERREKSLQPPATMKKRPRRP